MVLNRSRAAVDRVPWAAYWKAVLAFIAPAAGVLIFAVNEASAGGEAITQAEWVTALCTAVVTSGSVAAKGNVARKPADHAKSVQD
jgi:hypothetical protein